MKRSNIYCRNGSNSEKHSDILISIHFREKRDDFDRWTSQSDCSAHRDDIAEFLEKFNAKKN